MSTTPTTVTMAGRASIRLFLVISTFDAVFCSTFVSFDVALFVLSPSSPILLNCPRVGEEEKRAGEREEAKEKTDSLSCSLSPHPIKGHLPSFFSLAFSHVPSSSLSSPLPSCTLYRKTSQLQ